MYLLHQETQNIRYIIFHEGVSSDSAKFTKVANWHFPTSTPVVQQFLGFAIYYCHFIKDFTEIERSLHKLTECGTTFDWMNASQWVYDELHQ